MPTISEHAGTGIALGGVLPAAIESATAAANLKLQSLQERWPRAVELGIASQASIYHSYPYLFLAAFPALSPDQVEPLSVAASLFADSLFVADDVMDEDVTERNATTNVLRIQAMQFEGYQILHTLFPPAARFWPRFRDYLSLYAQACLHERRFAAASADWGELTEPLALDIAKGKSSLAKFVVAGLSELAADEAPLKPLLRTLDCYYIARQMVDDLSDWRQDLKGGCPSLLLARAISSELAGRSRQDLADQPDRVGRAIYGGGHARHTVELALQVLAIADTEAAALCPDLPWRLVMARLRERCLDLLRELQRIAAAQDAPEPARQSFELSLPAPTGPWQDLAWQAVAVLLQRRALRASPAAAADAPRWRRATAGGEVLARALVADALCDADAALGHQLRPVLEREVGFLLDQRFRSGLGGWGWGAVASGLPPDLEHLGRVLRVLVRAGAPDAAEEHCGPLLSLFLDQWSATGIPPFWLRREDSPAAPPGEADPAVLAQLLTTLALWDRARFHDALERGAGWIAERQRSDGSWASPGARGPYLPTAACIELLAAVRPGAPALGHAAGFLRRSQRDGGAWSREEASASALATSLALLGLGRAQPAAGEGGDAERACRGRDALLAMGFVPPTGGTLTVAFTLQAALVWQARAERPTTEAVP